MRLHVVPPILALSLLGAGYITPTWPAEAPRVEVRPVDVGGQRSQPYAVGEPIALAQDGDFGGVAVLVNGRVRFEKTGYYRQTIVSWASTELGSGGSRAEESVIWIRAGQSAVVRANAMPAKGPIVYWTDRTLFRWDYLGEGLPPQGPHTKTRQG